MSHLSGQGVASSASTAITDTSTVGGPTVKDSLDTLDADKAPLASPVFTGNARAVTPAAADNDTSIATTEFVQTELGDYAPLESPTFTGTAAAPTAAPGTNTTQLATTAFVAALGALKVDAAFTPGDAADWADPDPTTVQQAIDRLAAAVSSLLVGEIP